MLGMVMSSTIMSASIQTNDSGVSKRRWQHFCPPKIERCVKIVFFNIFIGDGGGGEVYHPPKDWVWIRHCNSGFIYLTGYPLKLHFQIFPVQIYVICDYYIHKTDLADLFSFGHFHGKYRNIFYL